ncbi:MAG: hypothetical protein AAFX39_03440 [Pseudomonadota bacterium]
MQARVLEEILQTQPESRLLFRYANGGYAPKLLYWLVGEGVRVQALKASAFKPLVAQPALTPALAAAGSGFLKRQHLSLCDTADALIYRLGLGAWRHKGQGFQMSRPGHQLVLQLNFTGEHDMAYRSTLRPGNAHPFTYWDHPVSREGFNTLAWARIDVDFDTGEALIDELQTDWVRFASRAYERAKVDGRIQLDGRWIPVERVGRYVNRVLRPHAKAWDEAMLSAAIHFIRSDLGLNRIYLHDADTGARLKGIYGALPPRSLYTDLPRRFCFRRIEGMPEFLVTGMRRRLAALAKSAPLRIWRIDLEPVA